MPLLPEQNYVKHKSTRKESRKQARMLKKVRKSAFSSHKAIEDVINNKFAIKKLKKKKRLANKEASETNEIQQKASNPRTNSAKSDELKGIEIEKIRRKQMCDLIKEEDGEIKRYAKKLGYNKRKSKNTPQVFVAEGLDYILDVCDLTKRNEFLVESEFEQSDSNDDDNNNDNDDRTSNYDEINSNCGESPSIESASCKASKRRNSCSNIDFDSEKRSKQKKVHFESIDESDTVTENIYGRLVNQTTGLIVGARKKLEELERNLIDGDEQNRQRMIRTIRGIANRLNEATLSSSIKQVRQLFESHPRNEVKEALTDCLFKAISVPFRLPDRLMLEYGVFLALCHGLISSQITAHFIHSLSLRLNDCVSQTPTLDDKSSENLFTILSHLSNFKVIKTGLIFDFLQLILERISEANISHLLVVFKYCGLSLRKADSTALKEFMISVQSTISSVEEQYKDNARMRFMFEILMTIKNNNMLKISKTFDPTILEHYRKVYRGLRKGMDSLESPFAISLSDLLNANEHGRRWVVGSAFDLLPQQQPPTRCDSLDDTPLEPALLSLAKKVRMNTDLRRRIFCTLMSADDEQDAFEKLLKLTLKDQQEREIVHICVLCCMREKSYNDYYAALLDRFCSFHRRFRLTTQYAIWDRLRQVDNFSSRRRANFANFLADLLIAESVGLGVLKTVEFGTLSSSMSHLLRKLFTKLFVDCPEKKLRDLFVKVVQNAKLKPFADGLQVFLHMVMEKANIESANDCDQLLIISRINFLDSIWGSDWNF